MPYIEAIMLDIDYEDRWNAPANRVLADGPNYVFCWSPEAPYPDCLNTNVMAIIGPDTAFDIQHPRRLEDMDSDTILLIEVADSGTHWMEPGDLSLNAVPPSIVQGLDGDGVHVLFADGSVWFLRSDVPFADLQKFFTIQGSKHYDRETVLAPFAPRRK